MRRQSLAAEAATNVPTPASTPIPGKASWRARLDLLIAAMVASSLGYDKPTYLWTAHAPWIQPPFQSLAVTPSEVALAILVVYGLLIAPAELGRWVPVGSRLAAAAGFLLILCSALSALGTLARHLSLGRLAEITVGALAYWTIAHRPRLARWIVIALCGLVLAELPIALIQEATQSTYPMETVIYGWTQEATAQMSGAAVVIGPGGLRWQRAMGSFLHPNIMGGFLALTLVFALVWLGPRPKRPGLLLAVLIVGWLELGLTFSRTAILGAVLGPTVFALGRWHAGRDRRLLGLYVTAAVVAGLVAMSITGPRLLGWLIPSPALVASPSVSQRILVDGVGLTLVRLHPWLGVGAGNFALAELQSPINAAVVDPAHTVPLLVAAESGIPAGIAWLLLVLAPVIAAWRTRASDRLNFWSDGAIVATVLTLSLLDHYLWTLPQGQATFWIALGVAAARPRDRETST